MPDCCQLSKPRTARAPEPEAGRYPPECDDEIMPLQERIETVGEDADLQEVYDTERHLLTLPAREREITYSSRVLNRRLNFSMICECEPHLLVLTASRTASRGSCRLPNRNTGPASAGPGPRRPRCNSDHYRHPGN